MDALSTQEIKGKINAQPTVHRHFIGGDWTPAENGATLSLLNPSTGEAFAEIADGTAADIDRAVLAARHAFEEGAWGRLSSLERGRMLTRLA